MDRLAGMGQGSEAELEEVEREFGQGKGQPPGTAPTANGVAGAHVKGVQKATHKKSGLTGLLRQFLSPVFLEVCCVTFLAEWGDRSQIATIGKPLSRDGMPLIEVQNVGVCQHSHTVMPDLALPGPGAIQAR